MEVELVVPSFWVILSVMDTPVEKDQAEKKERDTEALKVDYFPGFWGFKNNYICLLQDSKIMRYMSYYGFTQVHSKRRLMQTHSSATIPNDLIVIYQTFLVLKSSKKRSLISNEELRGFYTR